MSNLVSHARRELELLGEDPELVDSLCDTISKFAEFGHSGGSAAVAIDHLNKLLKFEELTPITDDPETWTPVGDGMLQSKRNPAYFSTDGGKSFTSVNDKDRKLYISEKKED